MVAPKTRKATSAVVGRARKAILPTIGHVPNKTCTPTRARCGATVSRSLDAAPEFTVRAPIPYFMSSDRPPTVMRCPGSLHEERGDVRAAPDESLEVERFGKQ